MLINYSKRYVWSLDALQHRLSAGADPGGGDCDDRPPKTYECNFFHHDFVQFGKQHSRHEYIVPSIVLSKQCCEVYFISLTLVNPYLDQTNKYY